MTPPNLSAWVESVRGKLGDAHHQGVYLPGDFYEANLSRALRLLTVAQEALKAAQVCCVHGCTLDGAKKCSYCQIFDDALTRWTQAVEEESRTL